MSGLKGAPSIPILNRTRRSLVDLRFVGQLAAGRYRELVDSQ